MRKQKAKKRRFVRYFAVWLILLQLVAMLNILILSVGIPFLAES